MPQCRNCDGHVTSRFARVFGDNGDEVYRCPDCSANPERYDGGPDADRSAIAGGWR
ncbi:hypothetical protein B4589_016145 (plasmid) [Halolamina sp. CBA1230]|uniref:DUF7563 family protein n=1 Tax=Haloferacaceae TaxID=1644056 RepID=UPI001301C244|nr:MULTISPECIES: hypothetical protein [Halorubraceae]QKY21780.1 hypothetical protein B4589_016145 [Halolamina sp. CBA1230]